MQEMVKHTTKIKCSFMQINDRCRRLLSKYFLQKVGANLSAGLTHGQIK